LRRRRFSQNAPAKRPGNATLESAAQRVDEIEPLP
jgi:hypothetical protein